MKMTDEKIKADVMKLLDRLAFELSSFLEIVLPSIKTNWWKETVEANLTFIQKRILDGNASKSLHSLDLAALLRVLDANWHDISMMQNFTAEDRHYAKEMQSVRNRWHHASVEGFSVDDVYRDVDTMQRFVQVLGTNDHLVLEIREMKSTLLASSLVPGREVHHGNEKAKETSETGFKPGQMVIVSSDPNVFGAVVAVLPGVPENRYRVFINGRTQSFYESQLAAREEEEGLQTKQVDLNEFHTRLSALQLNNPNLSTLYSLNAARIDYIPYQYRPVLRFIKSDRPRLLIADSVGVGKTIEAGLILRELQARRDINSILIICPKPLVTESKWLNEMKRFEESFSHLDGRTLRYCIKQMDDEGNWPDQYKKVIIPYSLFDESLIFGSSNAKKMNNMPGLVNLDPPPRFDLVIVDEAHHIRNADTFTHKAVRFFCDHAEAVVFLTATPIQLGNTDLFVLLNVLRPDLIIDKESFAHMAEPNPYINQAASFARFGQDDWPMRTVQAIEQAAATAWGASIIRNNPQYKQIKQQLQQQSITPALRIQLITEIEALHTFSGIINRTRRRDIGDFTIRKPETVNVSFTPSQQTLYNRIMAVQAQIMGRIHGDKNINFMMTTLRRQAASCLYGLSPFLKDILNRHLDELFWDEADNTEQLLNDDISDIQGAIQEILNSLRDLDPDDPKLEMLKRVIRDKQKLLNRKVMVFSSFRHTLSYIYENLKTENCRIGMIHGGTPDDERVKLSNRFGLGVGDPDCIDIMLFSEVGCEGLDYQFCDCIINYDLPWNPMRIEQRIGRIDRRGQMSETILIYNMITPGTVDADIYERCLIRIGVFNQSLGGSEEILGEINKEIKDIAENIFLTDEERKAKLQQLADNKIRLVQEEEELEQRQVELFGIRLPEEQIKKDIAQASSFWLSALSIQRLVTMYLEDRCMRDQEFILGEKQLKTLRLSQEDRNNLLGDYHRLDKKNTPQYREWEKWLKGDKQHLGITFSSECAMHNTGITFLMPLHPLVRQASVHFVTEMKLATCVKVKTKLVEPGQYEFALYQWHYIGIKEDQLLRPVTYADKLTRNLLDLLEIAQDDTSQDHINHGLDSNIIEALDEQHHDMWLAARKEHRQHTSDLVQYKKESLQISHKARISLLREQYQQANNDKIRLMRQTQITNADTDYQRHLQDLDNAIEKADLIAEPVAYGMVTVEDEA